MLDENEERQAAEAALAVAKVAFVCAENYIRA